MEVRTVRDGDGMEVAVVSPILLRNGPATRDGPIPISPFGLCVRCFTASPLRFQLFTLENSILMQIPKEMSANIHTGHHV